MPMTKGEIVNSYRQAKDQKTQIKVLAELNLTSREEIIKILREAGEDVQEKTKKKTTAKTAEKSKEQAAELVADAMTKAVTKSKEPEKAVCVTLNPSEAETLADFLGLTMVAAIQEKKNRIENPEYIEELAAIYRKCAAAAKEAGTNETPLVFQTEKRYLYNGGCVW